MKTLISSSLTRVVFAILLLLLAPNVTLALTNYFYLSDFQAGKVLYYPPSGSNMPGKTLVSVVKPTGLAFDSSGTLYIGSDSTLPQHASIYTTPVTGGGSLTPFLYNDAGLDQVHGLAFDSSGNLFAATASGHTVLKFTYPFTQPPTYEVYGDDIHDGLNQPIDVVIGSDGNLYVSDAYKPDPDGNTGRIFVFTAQHEATILSPQPSGGFCVAYGLAFDSHGDLYVSNAATSSTCGGPSILKFSMGTQTWTTFAGAANFIEPLGLLIDSSDNVYVADRLLNEIEKFSSAGGTGMEFAPGSSAPHFLAMHAR